MFKFFLSIYLQVKKNIYIANYYIEIFNKLYSKSISINKCNNIRRIADNYVINKINILNKVNTACKLSIKMF